MSHWVNSLTLITHSYLCWYIRISPLRSSDRPLASFHEYRLRLYRPSAMYAMSRFTCWWVLSPSTQICTRQSHSSSTSGLRPFTYVNAHIIIRSKWVLFFVQNILRTFRGHNDAFPTMSWISVHNWYIWHPDMINRNWHVCSPPWIYMHSVIIYEPWPTWYEMTIKCLTSVTQSRPTLIRHCVNVLC